MKKTAQDLYNDISRFVNGARPAEVKELAQLLSNDHPTLQQSTMGLCLQFIKAMADKSYVDARNEDSKAHAQAALEGIKQMWVKKYMDSGMNQADAEKQATAVIGNPQLPLI
jgi:hypothetical protein